MEEVKSSDDVKEEPLDIDFKNKQTEQPYPCEFGIADPYVTTSTSMWTSLVNRTLFLLEDEIRNKHPNHSNITSILVKEVNELLSEVNEFFKECWNPIVEEEESKDTLKVDGAIVDCLPCHPQNSECFYKLANDIPQSYSETIFSPLTLENDWDALDDSDLYDFSPNVEIDIKSETNDCSVVKKSATKKKVLLNKSKEEYVCDLCGKSFKLKDSLKNHVRVKHENKKIWKCRKCSKTYSYRRGLLEHKDKCKGPENRWILWGKNSNNPRCIHPDCLGKEDAKFKVVEIMRHILDIHTTPENSNIQCSECPKKFPMPILLRYHRQWEHGAKAEVCTICGKTVNSSMTVHMTLMHSVEKKFQCDKCDYQCKLKQQLSKHMKNHEDPENRKYKCDICGKGFLSNQKLREHILTHANIKAYKCEFCSQAFSNFSGHRQHMMRKHGLKFTCDVCGADSSSMRGLNIHKRDKHGVII